MSVTVKCTVVVFFLLVLSAGKGIAQTYLKRGEVNVISFQMRNGKKVAIVTGVDDKYIVYRFGTDKKIELEYPSPKDSTTWKKMFFNWHMHPSVVRLTIDLPANVEGALKDFINDWDKFDKSTAAFCTGRIKEILFEAYVAEGYSEEEASKLVDRIIPNGLPLGTPTDTDDAKEAGYKKIETFKLDAQKRLEVTVENIEPNKKAESDDKTKTNQSSSDDKTNSTKK